MGEMSVKDTIRGLLDCSVLTSYQELPRSVMVPGPDGFYVQGQPEVRVRVELLVLDTDVVRRLIPGAFDTLDRMVRWSDEGGV